MAYSPAIKAQEKTYNKPPKGTIPRGYTPYLIKDINGAKRNKNPLKRTKSILNQGKELYDIYCMVCHGKIGQGDGSIVPKFPRPPVLTNTRVNNMSDGEIFHIITTGQNLMPGYHTQISQMERWSIVHYLRVLYRVNNPSKEDLRKAKNW